ncbi:transcription antitermination factor NusB [Synechococcus sp. PCC 7336]|uniref:transcription antitermination factor NusB n=1 Tax=Synechococcus sp. PCC 7336 TaxID=195250 RepID=UPI000381444D|nr:transcription antitermination factor NusB [Synechococcus sp. PCC 7336]
MQSRRVARELALLAASQLPAAPDKLEDKQLEDFVVAAVRSLSDEMRDALGAAGDELSKGDRLLSEGELSLPVQLEPVSKGSEATQTKREAVGERVELARLQAVQKQLARLEATLRTADPARPSASSLLSELRGAVMQANLAVGSATQYLTDFETRLQGARKSTIEAIASTQKAINCLGATVTFPEFVQLADRADVRNYALQLVKTLQASKGEIDERLQAALVGWNLKRLGRVERDILRLSVVEIDILQTVPERVGINEAVELAKTYGGEESPAFVNGVLRRLFAKFQPASS